jgi:hypothetical protein
MSKRKGTSKMTAKKNPIAKAVTRIMPKIVRSRKAYTRKAKHKNKED